MNRLKKLPNLKKLVLFFLFVSLTISEINAQGPNAPEASGFEPVSATDMVNLSSGDMAYVLPLLEIDGFPVTLSYHAGIPMDMEASWTGLGWNINTGAISRGVVATPDDWRNGSRMNLTYLYQEQETFTVNVGVGIAKAAEVGVGLSWGSNKSLSGSVSASIGPISVSASTDGNISVGVSASTVGKFGFKGAFGKITEAVSETSNFGGSLSVSGNVNGGGISANVSGGMSSSNGMNIGLGASVSGNGVGGGFSIGRGNNTGKSGTSGGGGINVGSFSAGDFNIESSGFYIPLNIGIFNFGFGYSLQKIELSKRFSKVGYGSLYHNDVNLYNTSLGEKESVNFDPYVFKDYQRRNFYGDVYEQKLPQSEEDFISDYSVSMEKLNFSFTGYDSYNLNASGISGNLKPLIGENSVLIGEGYEGTSSRISKNKRMKVFYHNSKKYGINQFKPSKSFQNNNLYFTFDGHTTQDILVGGDVFTSQRSYNNLSIRDFVTSSGTVGSRPKSGSYIEVFTNAQIDASQSSNILIPTGLYKGKKSTPVSRTSQGYLADGIGGYKIHTPDGKIYHFSQPVYQYEQIQHNYLEANGINPSPLNSSSKREATPYATHWLLTAITGPDYIDDGDNYPDKDDLGYWVRLDHGQWTNAYVWRTPFDTNNSSINGERNYSTFNDAGINKADPGYFIQGRKDLYYLDKIVSKNNIVYFIKDIRKDGLGTNSDYHFYKSSSKTTLRNEESINTYENAKYETEYQLKLDKIVIENRTEKVSVDKKTGIGVLSGVSNRNYTNRYYPYGYFNKKLPIHSKTHRMHQSDNIIDVNDFTNYDYSRASKVIKFNYDYSLAKNSPNSEMNPNNTSKKLGKLSLKAVKNYGRGLFVKANENQLFDYMPSYQFKYHKDDIEHKRDKAIKKPNYINIAGRRIKTGEYYEFNRANKDSWGFIEGTDHRGSKIDAWSLQQIKTPQGSTIDVKYEEDDFYVEAFSRRYWTNNLKFKIRYEGTGIAVDVYNHNNAESLDFRRYFNLNDMAYFDLWFAMEDKLWFGLLRGYLTSALSLDIRAGQFKVTSVSQQKLTLSITNNQYTYKRGGEIKREIIGDIDCFLSKDKKLYNCHSRNYDYKKISRYTDIDTQNGDQLFTLSFKLLATKSPLGNSGGGLKVKEIIVKDDQNNEYITEYEYKNPVTGYSSGITSFYPVYGETFVPYQNELPGPGVMYEWVTMKAYGVDKTKPLGHQKVLNTQMRYHYYTLQSNFDIFQPNIVMKDLDGDDIFKTNIKDYNISRGNVTAKKIEIEKNLSKIGQLISIEELNSQDQILTKTTNIYTPRIGTLQETFSSMKSIYDFDFDDKTGFTNPKLYKRFLSVSSKSEKVIVLKSVKNYTPFGISKVEYSDPDPYLGTYRTSINTMADGTKIKNIKYPAYQYYPEMGSKIIDIKNKNMLTQEAMNITSVKVSNTWKTTNANITTWNKDWQYRDVLGNEPNKSLEVPVWRKHKSFVWKDNISADGTYATTLSGNNSYFNWGTGTPTSNKWQNVSEITRYNHYSVPLETKDINGNFASSKMADNWSKTVASGNAPYTEMYYSGVEFPTLIGTNITRTEDEFTFSNVQISNKAHTGVHSVSLSSSSKAFQITGSVGNASSDKFRPGKYKISFWAYYYDSDNLPVAYQKSAQQIPDPQGVKLIFNGVSQTPNTVLRSGGWRLHNYIIDVKSSVDLYVKAISSSAITLVDDYRMYPISSSMNSYVYDKNTDELTYILDANNMGTKFEYDKAGRLVKTYKEVPYNNYKVPHGFRLVNHYKYNYKK